MKYIIPILALFFCACKETQKPVIPVSPVSTDTIQEWYCTPIAPLPALKRAVGMKGKFWQTGQVIKIGFIGGTTAQRDMTKAAFAEWAKSGNLKFEFPTSGATNIRVSFNPGSAWSYIGIDCNVIGQNSATMNLGFGASQTAWHEIGHALGLLHEQQYPSAICWNEANVIKDLSGPPNNWNLATIKFNVLDYHNPANVITSTYDPISIMHYSIKASWTCNNVAIPGGSVISAKDKAFVKNLYPYPTNPTPSVSLTSLQVDSILNIMTLRIAKYQQLLTEAQADNAVVKRILGR